MEKSAHVSLHETAPSPDPPEVDRVAVPPKPMLPELDTLRAAWLARITVTVWLSEPPPLDCTTLTAQVPPALRVVVRVVPVIVQPGVVVDQVAVPPPGPGVAVSERVPEYSISSEDVIDIDGMV
jgi:hypothetical protein